MNFTAIDVETANACQSSICQFGYAAVRDGSLVDAGGFLIDPHQHFDGINMSIHSISPEDVVGEPAFDQVWGRIQKILSYHPIVSHGAFDRVAIRKALERIGLEMIPNPWIDSIRVIRRIWPEKFRYGGYGLKSACDTLGIELKHHHHAAFDALATRGIMLLASEFAQKGIGELAELSLKTLSKPAIAGEAIADGSLSGHLVVFTGQMHIPRQEMSQLARKAGAEVQDNLTKQTTLLVVSNLEWQNADPKVMTSKHKRAYEMVKAGTSTIRLMLEKDFMEVVL